MTGGDRRETPGTHTKDGNVSTETKDAAPGAGTASPAKKGLMQNTPMLIALVVFVVMAVEGAVLFVMLKPAGAPPATESKEDESEAAAEQAKVTDTGSVQSEVEIGSFNCSNNLAAPGSVLHISFKLAVTVPQSEKNNFDTVKEENKNRIQEAVIVVLRRSSLEDLNEPELGTVKRRLQESVNKVLGKSFVKDIIITDIRMLEQ